MEQRSLWLWLAASGITPRQFTRLMDTYNSVEEIHTALNKHTIRESNVPVSQSALQRLREAYRPRAMSALEAAMERSQIRLIIREDEDYPPLLRYLDEDAPFALFVRGTPGLRPIRTFAIVGTRRCTRYGEQATQHIAAGLAAAGVTVVSGMARGIDTAAHLGCLSVGGRTVAILGCGADVNYPTENAALLRRIVEEGGTVLSEYAPGVPPLASHFPMRNRIVSGMCSGMLIVEASARSGAMITVRHALAQGREVYALPGPVDSPTSEMPLTLLREGAQIATNAEDIIQNIRWLDSAGAETAGRPSGGTPIRTGIARPNLRGTGDAPAKLEPSHQCVVEALRENELVFSEIAIRTGFPTPVLNSHLTMLELQGIIVQLPGRVYALVR